LVFNYFFIFALSRASANMLIGEVLALALVLMPL